MSFAPDNFRGSKYVKRGRTTRASRTTVTVRAVTVDVEYTTAGTFLSATDTDASESPVVDEVLCVEVHGEDISAFLNDALREEIKCAIERGWAS